MKHKKGLRESAALRYARCPQLLAGYIALLFCLFCVNPTFAALNDRISVIVNGKTVYCNQAPYISNGRAIIPVKEIAGALGWNVDVTTVNQPNHVSASITINFKGPDFFYHVYICTVEGRKDVTVTRSGTATGVSFYERLNVTVTPIIMNDNVLMGAADLAKFLYAGAEWNGADRTVIIQNGDVIPTDAINRLKLYDTQSPVTIPNPAGVFTVTPEIGAIPAKMLQPGKSWTATPWTMPADSFCPAYAINVQIAGSCTWYAYGRFLEVNGFGIPVAYTVGGVNYLDNVERANCELLAVERDAGKIKAGSIASFVAKTIDNTGHLLFVEYVERDSSGNPVTIYYSDAGQNLKPENYGRIQKVDFAKFQNLYAAKTFAGCIVSKL